RGLRRLRGARVPGMCRHAQAGRGVLRRKRAARAGRAGHRRPERQRRDAGGRLLADGLVRLPLRADGGRGRDPAGDPQPRPHPRRRAGGAQARGRLRAGAARAGRRRLDAANVARCCDPAMALHPGRRGAAMPGRIKVQAMSQLFSPLHLGPLELPNRIVIAPMCQYSAHDGVVSDLHHIRLGNLALPGAGLLILEATAVQANGRISHADLGLWNDDQESALAALVASLRRWAPIPLGIQLAHAGRKASTARPWEGGGPIAAGEPDGWTTVSASALAYDEGHPLPGALDAAGIEALVEAFVDAARRAARIGLDLVEIHAAHGYLLHQFLSPLSNQRTDEYGGSLENRLRLLLRVFDAVRTALPEHVSVGVRISATDWVEGGWDLEQSIALARELDARGCHFIHVSSGGLDPRQQIAIG